MCANSRQRGSSIQVHTQNRERGNLGISAIELFSSLPSGTRWAACGPGLQAPGSRKIGMKSGQMLASVLLTVRGALRTCRYRLTARSALWRQFLAHKYPSADEKGGADNRRRGERGEILQHVMHSTRHLTRAW